MRVATRRRYAARASTAVAMALVCAAATPAAAQRTTTLVPGRPTAAATPQPDTSIVRRAALRFFTDSDYPPFNYVDQDGQLAGFNVEMARAICLELAAACDVQARPWNDLLGDLKRGEADAVIASHAITPGLLDKFDITDRYYQMPGRFAGAIALVIPDVTPASLDGLRIAVAKGSAHEAYLRAMFTLSAIQPYDNAELARDAVITGKADLLFDDGIGLAFWLLGTASKACCDFKGGPFFEPRYFGDGVGIVINRDDPELKAQLNAALKRLRETGREEELISRSFPLRGN